MRLVECEHLGEALERIGKEHKPMRWLYRGQTSRRQVHQISQNNQIFELENLYPQSFRFAANYTAISAPFKEQWRKEHNRAKALFHAFNSFLLSKYEAGRHDNHDRFSWLDPHAEDLRRLYYGSGPSVFSGFREKGIGLTDPRFVRLTWSLAQHYGVVTALLDVTWDPDVAVWFATSLWDPPIKPQALTGNGIIYRFDMQYLVAGIVFYNKLLESESDEGVFQAPPDRAFLEDLRKIPDTFALRPNRQQAAVISGLDAFKLISLLDAAPTIDAFLFPHRDDQHLRWPPKYAREHIVAPNDPFFDLKDEFDRTWAPHAEETFSAKYTHPVIILTPGGPKFANLPDEAADALESARNNLEGLERFDEVVDVLKQREQLYQLGMTLLGGDLSKAEEQFETVIKLAKQGTADRLSSLAHARIAVLLLLRGDFVGTATALNKSLDGPDFHPNQDWVGQLLQTIAQGATMLRNRGQGVLALPVTKRLSAVARRADSQELALEAELGATVLVGAIELEQGNTQLGLATLASVAQRDSAGLTLPERSWIAAAIEGLAQAQNAAGDKEAARKLYEEIVTRFAGDQWPVTVQRVASARNMLDALR